MWITLWIKEVIHAYHGTQFTHNGEQIGSYPRIQRNGFRIQRNGLRISRNEIIANNPTNQ